MKVGVKFCGHCSPRMDMTELFDELQKRAPEIKFVYYMLDTRIDILLVMHACQVECASIPQFSGPVVNVSPSSINRWPVEESVLCESVYQTLVALCDI